MSGPAYLKARYGNPLQHPRLIRIGRIDTTPLR